MATPAAEKPTPAGKKRPVWDWIPIGPPIVFCGIQTTYAPSPCPLSLNLPRQGGRTTGCVVNLGSSAWSGIGKLGSGSSHFARVRVRRALGAPGLTLRSSRRPLPIRSCSNARDADDRSSAVTSLNVFGAGLQQSCSRRGSRDSRGCGCVPRQEIYVLIFAGTVTKYLQLDDESSHRREVATG